MDISILKKEIKNTIDSLHEQVHSAIEYHDRIPQIEMDIAMGNIRKLYEDFYTLNKLNQENTTETRKTKAAVAENPAKEEAPPQKSAAEAPASMPKEETPVRKATESKTADTGLQHQAADKMPEQNENQQPKEKIEEKPVPNKEPKQKLPKDPKRTADLFSGNNSTLADKFMSEQDKSLGAKMQKNKITDLKAAIGINEKFIFVNELFDGDMQEYNKIIEQLNSFTTRNQAMAVLSSLKQKYSWDEKNPQYKEFQKYIERRYNNE